jgi:hypothetical protein
VVFWIKLMELLAAGGLFGAMLALPVPARQRTFGLAAAGALVLVGVGRGLLWDWSPVHLMPFAAGVLIAAMAWRKLRLGMAVLAVAYLAWIAQRGW